MICTFRLCVQSKRGEIAKSDARAEPWIIAAIHFADNNNVVQPERIRGFGLHKLIGGGKLFTPACNELRHVAGVYVNSFHWQPNHRPLVSGRPASAGQSSRTRSCSQGTPQNQSLSKTPKTYFNPSYIKWKKKKKFFTTYSLNWFFFVLLKGDGNASTNDR